MITPYIHEFLMISLLHVLAVISPGADFAIVVRQSICLGRKTALITSLGIASGIAIHVCYTLLGVGFIISQSDTAFTTAKVVGALYLTYIGVKLLLSKPQLEKTISTNIEFNRNHQQAFMLGFMTNLLNPKVTLFFLAIFTTVVSINTPLIIQSLYGFWIILSTALWFSLVSFFFSQAKIREKFLRHGYLFERTMGCVLLLFAIKLAQASF